ncbi:MAG: carotenoid 1,2-hydratase [Thiothrix sp.]|nr:carotenoid 1,2-hydratase [Thiothrix sp.]HPE61947.1 lipocalin-like domain-containing protein [Thiolinea sp.]
MKRHLPMRVAEWFLPVLLLAGCERQVPQESWQLDALLGGAAVAGFERALAPRHFTFPAEHAAHPGFRSEWWYVTGNLKTAQGRHFGYQVTFFRNALAPEPVDNPSPWATRQVWMAHVALTDVAARQHRFEQRLARGAAGLAGQARQPFKVWLEDWQLLGQDSGEFPWQLRVKTADFSLDLALAPQKPVVLQGEQGLSVKSAEPGNASYYYSFTRLATRGMVRSGTESYPVTGSSWLDREWSTSVLGAGQLGWDWFSLQLDDGQELMLYRLRREDGEADAHDAGSWVDVEGQVTRLGAGAVQLRPLRFWMAADGRRYPVAWELVVPERKRHWRVEALLDAQQMRTAVVYWEGAVQVVEADSGRRIGYGYLEMAGY